MVWARLDDQFPQHKKVWPRSDAAFRLHVAGICHSSWLLLNGRIEANRVAGLVPNYKRAALRELIDAGMWHEPGHECFDCEDPPPGFYVIHDYLSVNPSEEKVKADREARAERQRRWREKKAAEKAAKDAARDALRDASHNAAPTHTRPGPKGLGSGCEEPLAVESSPAPSGGDDRQLEPEQVELNVTNIRAVREALRKESA